jgi:hypothetical protein
MLEQYQETDEDLLLLPPENIGDMDEDIEDDSEAVEADIAKDNEETAKSEENAENAD